jgi:hypothetical protein
MKKQILSEEFRRMQKLAGLITENHENVSNIAKHFIKSNIPKIEYSPESVDDNQTWEYPLKDVSPDLVNHLKGVERLDINMSDNVGAVLYIAHNRLIIEFNVNYINENQTNVSNIAKHFIKSNIPKIEYSPESVDDNQTWEYPLKDVSPDLVNHLKGVERLNINMSDNVGAVLYIAHNRLIIEFNVNYINENQTNVSNIAKHFIKSNIPKIEYSPESVDDNQTWEYPLKDVSPDLVNHLKGVERLMISI